ncbi:putative ATP-dependent RNA helicase DHR1 [Teratosphaeriaceae sp. CCFEE 6253]|nr:putative ATP-dependent RNA helicase DHR1 [Teratosphaeriaceae sp. CCFEE 6253]
MPGLTFVQISRSLHRNARVRAMAPYVARERKHKKRAKALNAPAPEETKVSGKKRQRLEKYIETKMRKEENLDLLKKLAANKVNTSLYQSSKTLGRVRESKRERVGRALREKQAGIDGGRHDEVLFEPRGEVGEDPTNATGVARDAAQLPFGAGLKRPLETDDAGRPVLKRRKRQRKAVSRAPAPAPNSDDDASASSSIDGAEGEGEDEDEWNGFGSDDESSSEGEADDDDSASSVGEASEASDSESAPSTTGSDKKQRVSAFKQWADTSRNAAIGFTPSAPPTTDAAMRAKITPRQPLPDASLPAFPSSNGIRDSRPAAAITIPRTDEIQAARLELPVVQEEQRIMEAIHGNPITIVCGATGSGKTTQVPQMMLESGCGSHIGARGGLGASSGTAGLESRGMIGVTQPRRIAATSVAERVRTEVGAMYRDRIGSQVRYDKNVGPRTAIKFMTDGILLREIDADFLLSKYSAIILDEAHERSVNTDILIGMLSRVVPLRASLAQKEPGKYYPLKLVIMSATLRTSDLLSNPRLFRDGVVPPVVEAEGRQYPVTNHFSRRTQRDYAEEMVEKVARGHRKLPAGGMLVFLTSQEEIRAVARRLGERLGGGSGGGVDDYEDRRGKKRRDDEFVEGEEGDEGSEDEVEITGLDPDADDDDEFRVAEDDDTPSHPSSEHHRERGGALKPHILPLYAALRAEDQLRVFEPPPAGSRLIVLATNVAETSLTIPAIRYVFDCGRAKEKRYDIATGVQTFEVDWISQASASQRMGRAGRTGPGHCYRLYSSAVFERYFAEHSVPEILRTPLEGTVLQLKAMEIEDVGTFPFPTPPGAEQLEQAERLLRNLGAIGEGKVGKGGEITETGRQTMGIPVNPRFAKMILLGKANGVLGFAIAVVAGLAVGDVFVPEAVGGVGGSDLGRDGEEEYDSDPESRREKRAAETEAHSAAQASHQAYTRAQARLSEKGLTSDIAKLLTAIRKHAAASSPDQPASAARQLCAEFYLREKAMSEIQQLRAQLHHIVAARYPASESSAFSLTLEPAPTGRELALLDQVVAAGYVDRVAIRADLLTDAAVPRFGRKATRAGEVAYRALVPTTTGGGGEDEGLQPQERAMRASVFVHGASVLARLGVAEMPRYVVYSHLSRAAPRTITGAQEGKVMRTRMHPLATVGAKQLAVLAEGTPMLELGQPVGKIEAVGGGGRRCWVNVGMRAPGERGEGWPLGVWKVEQKKGPRGHWAIETVLTRLSPPKAEDPERRHSIGGARLREVHGVGERALGFSCVAHYTVRIAV